MQAIHSNTVTIYYFGRVIEDYKKTLEEMKDLYISLFFIKGFANNVAHYMETHSSSIAERKWSMDQANFDFKNVLSEDLKC